MSIDVVESESLSTQREYTIRNINNMTKGLLNVVHRRIEFLHRIVKDFTLTRDMDQYLCTKLPADFNGFICIATAYLGHLKTTSHTNSLVAGIVRLGLGQNSGPFISQLNLALTYASDGLKSETPSSTSIQQKNTLLDEYENAVNNMSMRDFHPKVCDGRLPFREELLRHSLSNYIARRSSSSDDFFDIFDESPLFAAPTPMSISTGESPAPVSGVLKLILERGNDLNAKPTTSHLLEAVSPLVVFSRGVLSVFNMLSCLSMFPALRFNDSLNNGFFDLMLAHGANPNQPLLDRRGAHTVFSHFLDISLSSFLGNECFEGYLRALEAFLRAGASLGTPIEVIENESEQRFGILIGNLARSRPEESVLASYCSGLSALLSRLSADPERAKFVLEVTERLVSHCNGSEEDLRQLSAAISQGVLKSVSGPLLEMIERKLEKFNKRKRQRGS